MGVPGARRLRGRGRPVRAAARAFGWLDRNTGANPRTSRRRRRWPSRCGNSSGAGCRTSWSRRSGTVPRWSRWTRGSASSSHPGWRTGGRGWSACRPRAASRWCGPWLGEAVGPDQLDPTGTVADGIAVVRPAIGDAVLDAVRGGGGAMVAVDYALLGAVAALAALAGVGAEPAGAAALAGLRSVVDRAVDRQETVVLLVTGRDVRRGRGPAPRTGGADPGGGRAAAGGGRETRAAWGVAPRRAAGQGRCRCRRRTGSYGS